jgi:hypothetical protein
MKSAMKPKQSTQGKPFKAPSKALRFGGKKGARTPVANSVGDTNTKQMSAGTWTPRDQRQHRS